MARILSIEDDADMQHLIGIALHKDGYEMHYAFTGKEGYEKILTLNPDVIILDLMLPIMTGVQILDKMRASKDMRDIPVIVVTSFYDDLDIVKNSVEALGAVEYIRKPVRVDDLHRCIRRCLARRPPRQADGEAHLSKGAIRADPHFRTVWVQDRLVATLPPKRFELLRLLLEAKGAVPRKKILKLWAGKGSEAALEKAVQRLREDMGPESRRLQTTLDGYELVG